MAAVNHEDTNELLDLDVSSNNRRKQPKSHFKGQELTTKTLKTPPFSYARLQLSTGSTTTQPDLDELTVRSYITTALKHFLGLTGSAISVDVLKVDGEECWIRVPREDLSPTLAALGGWVGGNEREGRVGWIVKGSGIWLNVLVADRDVDKIWND